MLSTSKPVAIPSQTENETISYREIIKQLAAQITTKPYGDIPPPMFKKKKRTKKEKVTDSRKVMRRMSHVEDWIVVDSKESLPDEEELVQSPIRNFLFGDFLTEVLPLHMPPPSLSKIEDKKPSHEVILSLELLQEYDDDEEEEEEEEKEYEKMIKGKVSSPKLRETYLKHKNSLRRHSISSFNLKKTPSITTASYAISSSPPQLSNTDSELWKATLVKLKQSLSNTTKKKKLIPMPIPPKRPTHGLSQKKRRSEATTQPRFNPDTNTYTRDTRSNPDHLRMISAELNMMRARKLLSPLKPRGFLPRRKDIFIRGENRKMSRLMHEIIIT
ncbi:uncharacterized protein BX663DRAFT_498518 [Cokeromyces recurvatus]|uniref:uncharacterized protein n=1 Tax=Cokeromyces recurvatus TaxID=90255 RepID=UPI002220AB92|nr:uncharacterized protein BX663DRAFT_498518 [Cokeromyces recurvatus]KAI7906017.1 hypothetical protein BX663DRAFT_498518 [Cokeromyces recurvatus]